jgi:hypothetical protein
MSNLTNANLILSFAQDLKDFTSDWSALGIKSIKVEFEPQGIETISEVSKQIDGRITNNLILEYQFDALKDPKVSILLIADSPLKSMSDLKEEQGIEQLENKRQD